MGRCKPVGDVMGGYIHPLHTVYGPEKHSVMLIILLSYDKGTLHFLHTRLICLVFFLLDANEGSVTSGFRSTLIGLSFWTSNLSAPPCSFILSILAHFVLLVHCLMKQPGQRRGPISRYDWSSQVSGKKPPRQAVLPVFTEPGEKEKSMLACWEFVLLARWPVLPEHNRK